MASSRRRRVPRSSAKPQPESLLGGLTASTFLRDYWQKKPLLIRQAIPAFKPFLSPDELAGLACDEEVNSRLVIERGGARPWQVVHGPLSAADFKKLPRSHWTLLVTDIDKVVRPAADLLEHFKFIPSWRIDDLMISYAADRGSVGPHIDSYDVFLLQAQGRRRWQVSHRKFSSDDFIPGLDLRILDNFVATREWLLEAGDMLYLPPGMAHYGVAEGECLTYSIGFRAPSHRELLASFGEYAASKVDESQRYGDAGLQRPSAPGELSPAARRKFRQIIRAAARDEATIDDWLGRFLTETGPWGAPQAPGRALNSAQFSARWARRHILRRSERCRFAHIADAGGTTLYVDGQSFAVGTGLRNEIAQLTGERRFDHRLLARATQRPELMELLRMLYNKGYLEFE